MPFLPSSHGTSCMAPVAGFRVESGQVDGTGGREDFDCAEVENFHVCTYHIYTSLRLGNIGNS